ncbi:MAG: hypothetical protein OQL18_02720, partial [Deltaproteobacteria bacterium]|nr:hypothetical protein [Deltaproteobacteria bacterium]
MNKQLKKFLNNRATISPWSIVGTDRNNFTAVAIIPALAEMESLPQTLASLTANPEEYLQQTLILVVVNNRIDAATNQKENNRKTLEWLKSQPYLQLNLAFIDASSPTFELPTKEGVGLARKIGFDLALQFMDWSKSTFFISLDADTLVDQNYLPAIFKYFQKAVKGGVVLPFRHQLGETREQEAAIRDYELYLRSYLFGLQQAGSPYAYHAIGSAFACRAEAYIAAGGMNRRHAAEDFYFLQQLAKVSGIEMLQGTVIHPSPRISTRVPFGTGKAVQSQIEKEQQIYSFISADSFQLLKNLFGLIGRHLDSSAETVLNAATAL